MCVCNVCALCLCLSALSSFLAHLPIWVKFEDIDVRNIRLWEVFWKLGNWVGEKSPLPLMLPLRERLHHPRLHQKSWVEVQMSPPLPPYYPALPAQMCWPWHCVRREAEPWHCLGLLCLPADVEGSFSLPTPGSRGGSQCWGIKDQLHSLVWYRLFRSSPDFEQSSSTLLTLSGTKSRSVSFLKSGRL